MDVEAKKPVSWGSVIGGVVLALVAGVILVPVSMLGGGFTAMTLEMPAQTTVALGVTLSILISGTAYWGLWWLTRRSNADLATGIIVGGFLMVLLSGGCGALISSLGGANFN